MLTNKKGTPIATGATRIVVGERGAFVEFTKEQVIKENLRIPADQRWRIHNDYKDLVFYVWYAVDTTKIYFQRKPVRYADYRVGFLYVQVDLALVDGVPVRQTDIPVHNPQNLSW